MRFIATLAAALILVSCTITPVQLRQKGPITTYERSRPPDELAKCLANAIRNTSGNLFVWQEKRYGGRIDVGGQVPEVGTVMLFEISPAASGGSKIVAYLYELIASQDRQEAARELRQMC